MITKTLSQSFETPVAAQTSLLTSARWIVFAEVQTMAFNKCPLSAVIDKPLCWNKDIDTKYRKVSPSHHLLCHSKSIALQSSTHSKP